MPKLTAKLAKRTMFPTCNGQEWFEAGTVITVREDSFANGQCTAKVVGVPDSRTRIPVDRLDPNA